MLKNLGIDLVQSEKKTLFSFLSLYLFLCILILSFLTFIYISFEKNLMLQEKREILQEYSNDLIFRLKDLHINFDKYKFYPRDEKFKSAILDSEKNVIFSTFDTNDISFENEIYLKNDYIYFTEEPESYYLGSKYIVLQIKDNILWFDKIINKIVFYLFLSFLALSFIGYFLLKLFLAPMRNNLKLLDLFIKDTTHELNTPIASILANIEMLSENKFEDKIQKKLVRVELAANTISNIYDDLTYLALDNKIISNDENINLKKLLLERVEYFKTISLSKTISFNLTLNEIFLNIDKKKITKVIDNLISNSIKYNKVDGKIFIELSSNSLSIQDTGFGMKKSNIEDMFIRYKRFSSSVGGFGIGLSIVKMICDEYNINIKVESKINEGTKVRLSW